MTEIYNVINVFNDNAENAAFTNKEKAKEYAELYRNLSSSICPVVITTKLDREFSFVILHSATASLFHGDPSDIKYSFKKCLSFDDNPTKINNVSISGYLIEVQSTISAEAVNEIMDFVIAKIKLKLRLKRISLTELVEDTNYISFFRKLELDGIEMLKSYAD